ncbi:uncharacterized protein LOC129764748 [Toxorhynchites rutilus septentrionalis]|uniref:uncharacterized protein LOC129764748 n=1 Tax=Toxorhynchites rutilus septentrionalis TaxID=329112 RepID=UPI002478D0A7|nr:uncharacterized protein LOC129764748 [Toxorhynchites rutilus septentrionalis]
MAKGTRKKTKWVSLSLVNTSSTDSDATQNLSDKSSTSTRGIKTYKTVVTENNGEPLNRYASKVYDHATSDRKSPWFTYGRSRKPPSDSGATSYSSTEHDHSHLPKLYAPYSRDHYNNFNHQNHSGKRTYYSNNNESNYRSSTCDKPIFNSKNELNDETVINEDEYTKITTPRQDVLFKKGYLSRPKRNGSATTTISEDGMITASSFANGTVDESDVMTASGSVSATESIMSDATYLTEGHFVDYPTPYPYFGYFDQSGVLVMNGFAVDNSGFSYMNGGQTYIYPPNYHCQPTFEGDNQMAGLIVNGSVAEPSVEPIHSEVIKNSHTMDATGIGDSACCDSNSLENNDSVESEGASRFQQAEWISDDGETLVNGTVHEQGRVSEVDNTDNSDQQVPQEQIDMNFYVNGYDYAQLYNTFYYPSCVMAPLTVFENVPFYDQCGFINEDYDSRAHSFKKRKKRYRNWEENTALSSILEPELAPSAEVSAIDAGVKYNAETRTTSEIPPNELTKNVPSNESSATLLERSPEARKPDDRSQINQAPQMPIMKLKMSLPKSRKKNLIESTLAFAMQNIDLTKEAACRQSECEVRRSEENAWKTMRNGKEIIAEEDRELRFIDTTSMTKMASIKEIPESCFNEERSYETTKQENVLVAQAQQEVSTDQKNIASRKGKKTAKGKGRKQKKNIFSQQQKGFELIEPEFSITSTVDENNENTIDTDESDSYQKETIEIVQPEAETEFEHKSIDSFQEVKNIDSNTENVLGTECQSQQVCSVQTEEVCLSMADAAVNCTSINSHSPQQRAVEVSSIKTIPVDPEKCHENEVPLELAESGHSEGSSTMINDMNGEESEGNCSSPILNIMYPTPGLISNCDEEICEEENDSKCDHFSGEECSENFDSGLQSPAAFIPATSDEKERKLSFSSYKINSMHMTDAVTKWLSETLNSKKLEEMFIIPEDPTLLQRIHQFNLMSLHDSFLLSSDSYSSSSGDEAEDVDSDYMSDIQLRKHQISLNDCNPKTESQKDPLAKQTANGHHRLNVDHSNHKQKRCIIM